MGEYTAEGIPVIGEELLETFLRRLHAIAADPEEVGRSLDAWLGEMRKEKENPILAGYVQIAIGSYPDHASMHFLGLGLVGMYRLLKEQAIENTHDGKLKPAGEPGRTKEGLPIVTPKTFGSYTRNLTEILHDVAKGDYKRIRECISEIRDENPCLERYLTSVAKMAKAVAGDRNAKLFITYMTFMYNILKKQAVSLEMPSSG